MRWLVDGMNVIGSRPDGWWRDRAGAMRRLVAELDTFAAVTAGELHVVLDGRERDVGSPTHVAVSFAPGGRDAADHEIARLVEADGDPSTLTVVTSDRELVARVAAAGAAVEGVRRFGARMQEAAGRG
ncbi:MAG TPA: NYN domain-containing protein [Baekduia sp.]|nr:NYN domain-containing protein [Baekduia sp.]